MTTFISTLKIYEFMVVVKDKLMGHHSEVVGTSLFIYSHYPENKERIKEFFFLEFMCYKMAK